MDVWAQDLSNVGPEDLTPEFKADLQALSAHIVQKYVALDVSHTTVRTICLNSVVLARFSGCCSTRLLALGLSWLLCSRFSWRCVGAAWPFCVGVLGATTRACTVVADGAAGAAVVVQASNGGQFTKIPSMWKYVHPRVLLRTIPLPAVCSAAFVSCWMSVATPRMFVENQLHVASEASAEVSARGRLALLPWARPVLTIASPVAWWRG